MNSTFNLASNTFINHVLTIFPTFYGHRLKKKNIKWEVLILSILLPQHVSTTPYRLRLDILPAVTTTYIFFSQQKQFI
jgi:hypothetical protein